MAITRTNLGLGLCVILLAALRFMGGGNQASAVEGGDAFGAFTPDMILRLTIADATDPDAQDLVLKRSNASSPWTLESRRDFPALAYPVDGLLAAIDNLRLQDLVSEESGSHSIFGVGEGQGMQLGLESPGGEVWNFVLGGIARGAGGTRVYMRSQGEKRVFAATGFGELSLRPSSWIDASVVDFDATLITQIEFRLGEVPVVIRRNDKGIWRDTSKNKVAPRIPVEDLIGEALGLVLSDISILSHDPEPQGLGATSNRITFSGNQHLESAFDPIEIVLGGEESPEQRAAQGGGDLRRHFIRSEAWSQQGGEAWVGLLDGGSQDAFMTGILDILGPIFIE
jgi:hypothetical protein